jgi:hypothetical protein
MATYKQTDGVRLASVFRTLLPYCGIHRGYHGSQAQLRADCTHFAASVDVAWVWPVFSDALSAQLLRKSEQADAVAAADAAAVEQRS